MQKTSLTAFLEKDSSSLGLSVEVAAEGRRGSWGSSPKTHLTTVEKWGRGVCCVDCYAGPAGRIDHKNTQQPPKNPTSKTCSYPQSPYNLSS